MKRKEIKEHVKGRYAQIAKQDQQSCCSACAGGISPLSQAEAIGYLKEHLEHVPEEALMGLGCGSPTAVADLKPGEVVVDLGSGAGVDVFLAANKVGTAGRVIGVDMTEEMVDRAKRIAGEHGYHNVEFRLGEIEKLPIEDDSVDVVISNCVINLAPDKSEVFREAYRILKPGGRLVVSDIVSEKALSHEIKNDPDAWAGCIAGALKQREYLKKLRNAGFGDVQVLSSSEFYAQGRGSKVKEKLLSITVRAYK